MRSPRAASFECMCLGDSLQIAANSSSLPCKQMPLLIIKGVETAVLPFFDQLNAVEVTFWDFQTWALRGQATSASCLSEPSLHGLRKSKLMS